MPKTNTQTAQHTPTPWDTNGFLSNDGIRIYHRQDEVAHLSDIGLDQDVLEAHAAFIIRAVNAHDDLLAALKEARNFVLATPFAAPTQLARIDAAIAKAEGR